MSAILQKTPADGTWYAPTGVSSVDVDFVGDTLSGSTLIVCVQVYHATTVPTITLSDGGSHTWTKVIDYYLASNSRLVIGYASGITGRAAHRVTASFSSSCDPEIVAFEVAGIGNVRTSNVGSGTAGGTAQPGAVTVLAGDFMIAAIEDESNDPGTVTWADSVVRAGSTYSEAVTKIALVDGSENPSWTLTAGDDWVAGIVAFAQLRPVLTLTNQRPVARFSTLNDGPLDQTFLWPQGAGSSVRATVYFIADGTGGNVAFKAALEAITPSDAVDLDSTDSFDAASSSGGISLPATAGQLARADIVLTNVDSVAEGDYVRLRLTRDTGIAGNASANVDVLGVVVEKL